ncbi:hypothetical protein WOLCODRAFT_158567 [Wolfiporia cocos MD-104 SS10]|uniref:Uncharacterized protein n=1 Tax=Wolfiporia cocos (strain MD-104) TaxID=742152 RepID=A0A2H3JMS2_WOLCO|nr:hypothetical protein WOLCODRAFT_158567 [Wolfiporia cocos MD-104 SS10]
MHRKASALQKITQLQSGSLQIWAVLLLEGRPNTARAEHTTSSYTPRLMLIKRATAVVHEVRLQSIITLKYPQSMIDHREEYPISPVEVSNFYGLSEPHDPDEHFFSR